MSWFHISYNKQFSAERNEKKIAKQKCLGNEKEK